MEANADSVAHEGASPMTDADRERFASAMYTLAEVFGDQVSMTRLSAYFIALQDWSLKDLLPGIERCIRTLKFFPKPVELAQAADDAREDRFQAWLDDDRKKHALAEDRFWALRGSEIKALGSAISEVIARIPRGDRALTEGSAAALPGIES